MRMYYIMAIACGLLFLSACGGSSDSPNGKASVSGKKAAKTDTSKKYDACKLMDSNIVVEIFELADGLIQPGQTSGAANACAYGWPKPDRDVIGEANQKAMRAYLDATRKAQMNGETPPQMPAMVGEDAEVFFNFTPMGSTEGAEVAMNANIENLRKGLTGSKNGITATFKIDFDVEVQDVGDQAVWSTGRHQLMVRKDHMLLYLTIKAMSTADQDLDRAMALMNRIISRL